MIKKCPVLITLFLLINSCFFTSIFAAPVQQTPAAQKATVEKDTAKKNGVKQSDDDEDIEERQMQEVRRTLDPKTKTVPVERLIAARDFRNSLLNKPSSSGRFRSRAAIPGIQWDERGPTNVGGRTRALMFDLGDKANGYKKVWAGGVGGGLWYTTDITAVPVIWNKVNDFFDNIAISCITQNPNDPAEILVGTGEGFFNSDAIRGLGVWKTSDGGNTWTQLSSTINFSYINSIMVDSQAGIYLATDAMGVQRSSDGGSTWTQVLSGSDSGVVGNAADLQLASNGDIYASFGTLYSKGEIFLSDYSIHGSLSGSPGTWTNITPDPNGALTTSSSYWQRIKLACAPNAPNILYAAFEEANEGSMGSVQQYNKSTNSWTVKTLPAGSADGGNAYYSLAMTVDPNNQNKVYLGTLDAAMSADGGSTWSPATQWYIGEVPALTSPQFVHADHHAYVFAPGSSNRLLMGTDGGVFYAANADTTLTTQVNFQTKDNTYNVTQFYSIAMHPTNLTYALGGTQDNGTQQFTTTGLNATSEATGGDGGYAFIDQQNGNIQISSYIGNNWYLSTNGGVSFQQSVSNGNGSFINPADYDSRQKNLYAGNTAGSYFRWLSVTGTAGVDTASVKVSAFNGADITSVTLSPITKNRVYFGLNNAQVVMVDNANTVNGTTTGVILNPGFASASVSCIAIDPVNENHMLITYFNYGTVSVFESHNALSSSPVWNDVEGNLPDMPVRWAMFYPGNTNKAVIATELGVWSTDSLGVSSPNWAPTNSGLANVRVDMLKYRPSDQTLAAATHGRGLFTATIPAVSLGTIAGNSSVCAGSVIQLTDSTPGGAWTSDNPDIAIVSSTGSVTGITAGTADIYYSSSGVYSELTITVNALTPPLILASTPTTFFDGGSVTLVAYGGSKFLWSTGDTTAMITVSRSGRYQVTSTNASGCTDTSATVVVTVNPLPATNFKVLGIDATCNGSNNGQISIVAAAASNYNASISGTGVQTTSYPFTDSVRISNLSPGTYNVCLTLPTDTTFSSCYTIVISQPQNLSVYSVVDELTKTVQLNLSGSSAYIITLNGRTSATTDSTVMLQLSTGVNQVRVTTNKLCQGTFARQIVISDQINIFPNPFAGLFTVDMGANKATNVLATVSRNSGIKLYAALYSPVSGRFQIDLSRLNLNPGVYVLNLQTDTGSFTFKLIKQ